MPVKLRFLKTFLKAHAIVYPGILGAVRRRVVSVNVNLDSVGRRIAPPVPRDIMIIQTVNLVIAFLKEQSKYRTLLIN